MPKLIIEARAGDGADAGGGDGEGVIMPAGGDITADGAAGSVSTDAVTRATTPAITLATILATTTRPTSRAITVGRGSTSVARISISGSRR